MIDRSRYFPALLLVFAAHVAPSLGGQQILNVNRIDWATRPTVSAKTCGGFDTEATNGPGAASWWCRRVLDAAVAGMGDNGLVGLSYGIFTWDTWSKRMSNHYRIPTELYDCYQQIESSPSKEILEYKAPSRRHEICVDGKTHTRGGRRFESFAEHMQRRKGKRTVVKMDVEGSEWEALASCSDECLNSIDLLDLEIHLCEEACPKSLLAMAVVLERLLDFFEVTGRATGNDLPFDVNSSDDVVCHPRKGDGRVYPSTASISYVNKARLAELLQLAKMEKEKARKDSGSIGGWLQSIPPMLPSGLHPMTSASASRSDRIDGPTAEEDMSSQSAEVAEDQRQETVEKAVAAVIMVLSFLGACHCLKPSDVIRHGSYRSPCKV